MKQSRFTKAQIIDMTKFCCARPPGGGHIRAHLGRTHQNLEPFARVDGPLTSALRLRSTARVFCHWQATLSRRERTPSVRVFVLLS